MKKLWAISILIIGIILLSILWGTDRPETAIVAHWKEIEGNENIEFFKDGTFTIVEKGISLSGDYKFIDENTVRIDLGGIGALAGPQVFKISFAQGDLILTESNGKISRYRNIDNEGLDSFLNINGKLGKIQVQNELKTPDGYIVKIELIETDLNEIKVKGYVENPTNNSLKNFNAGILIKYIDEFDLDKKSVWKMKNGLEMGSFTNIESRHMAPLDFEQAYGDSNIIPDSTSEIIPYFNLLGGEMYPPCFADDPRRDCYEREYIPGVGFTDVPKKVRNSS